MTQTGAAYAAVVLAGGAGRRLSGAAKPDEVVGRASLLSRVLAAVEGAATTVVVGDPRPVPRPVRWCREEPAGGGPVAALAAGLAHVTEPHTLLLAADLPFVAPAVPALVDALTADATADAAALVHDGRRGHLTAAWRTDALRARVAALGDPAGLPARLLYDGATVAEVEDIGGWGADCDTWDELEQARARAEGE